MRRALVMVVVIGCGDDRPDTGYGRNQPVPPTKNCGQVCDRLADCAVALCNEDTNSTRFTALESFLRDDCLAGCSEAAVDALTDAVWTCNFTDSCRQVLDHDSCDTGAQYNCD